MINITTPCLKCGQRFELHALYGCDNMQPMINANPTTNYVVSNSGGTDPTFRATQEGLTDWMHYYAQKHLATLPAEWSDEQKIAEMQRWFAQIVSEFEAGMWRDRKEKEQAE